MTAAPALPIGEIRDLLSEQRLDGWLLWDFRRQNPIASHALGFEGQMLTRRWAYWIPRGGEPVLLVHAIERASLPPRPGTVVAYAGWRELEAALGRLLAGHARVAMEYSPRGAIPYLSRVDAGTIELVRSFGVEVVSSAELVELFLCRLSPGQVESHRRAALAIDAVKDEAFRRIAGAIRAGRPLLETEVQAGIVEDFARRGLVTDHPPIVAVNEHAGDPHHVPRAEGAKRCGRGDLVLIDLWAKEDDAAAVWADVTWTGFAGTPPDRVAEVFDVVLRARDVGVETIDRLWTAGERVEGWMVDRAVRDSIAARGFGDRFVHRTGHSITAAAVHGDGANLDDFETHDVRPLVAGLCFSIEPGVYLPEFGIRSEIDVVLEPSGPRVYTPVQRSLVPLA